MNSNEILSLETYNKLQEAVTLATLAYDNDTLLLRQLNDPNLATKANWQLVWGPSDLGSNRMYVVKSKSSNEYMIAIRGTIESVESVFLDADSLELSSLPWDIGGAKMISDGMADGWNHLNAMVDPKTKLNLYQFINSLGLGIKIYVTGHSQGACLASVVAVWLLQTFNKNIIIPYTFASESAGNYLFANLYNSYFNTVGLRVYNPFDIVPMGFADLDKIKQLYGKEPPYVLCPDGFKAIIDSLEYTLPNYVQVGTGYQLKGFIVPVKGAVDVFNRSQVFIDEIEIQHSCFTYLHLLNAPLTYGAPKIWPPKYIVAKKLNR